MIINAVTFDSVHYCVLMTCEFVTSLLYDEMTV